MRYRFYDIPNYFVLKLFHLGRKHVPTQTSLFIMVLFWARPFDIWVLVIIVQGCQWQLRWGQPTNSIFSNTVQILQSILICDCSQKLPFQVSMVFYQRRLELGLI